MHDAAATLDESWIRDFWNSHPCGDGLVGGLDGRYRGDYERFFEENGHRYHHIINPTTGKPTEGILTVTVIGPDGTMTDGLDTAIFVLGVEKGLELIEHYPEYETIIVDSAGKVSFSQGLVAPN